MRSVSTFSRLTGIFVVVTLLAIGGFSQLSVHAGAPAQSTTAATSAAAAPTVAATSAVVQATAVAPTVEAPATSAAAPATSAAVVATSAAAPATSAAAAAGAVYPPCPPVGTAAAVAPAATTAATMAGTASAPAPVATANANPGYLGVRAEQVDDCGTRVVEVVVNGPASKTQLQADDVVVAIDGTAAADILTLRHAVENHQPGDTITLTVERGTNQMDIKVTLGSRPPEAAAVATSAATMAATQ